MMTEKEVEELEKELFGDLEIERDVEIEIVKDILDANIKHRKRLKVVYKASKHMRNDERMKGLKTEVKDTEKLIEYYQTRLKELEG